MANLAVFGQFSFQYTNLPCYSGGFMLIRSPNGTYDFIDFREAAPAAAHKDMFVDDPSKARVGGLAVGVP